MMGWRVAETVKSFTRHQAGEFDSLEKSAGLGKWIGFDYEIGMPSFVSMARVELTLSGLLAGRGRILLPIPGAESQRQRLYSLARRAFD